MFIDYIYVRSVVDGFEFKIQDSEFEENFVCHNEDTGWESFLDRFCDVYERRNKSVVTNILLLHEWVCKNTGSYPIQDNLLLYAISQTKYNEQFHNLLLLK